MIDMETTLEIVNETISHFRDSGDLVSIHHIVFSNREMDMLPYRATVGVFADGRNQILDFENVSGSWYIKTIK